MPNLPSPIPHPLSYLDAPGWLREALEWVVGVDWPAGDEKTMRQLADAWYEAGRQVGPMLEDSDRAALEAVTAFGGPDGEAAQALLTLWRRLGGSPEAALSQVVDLFGDLGEFVDATANEIEGVKLEFYIELLLMLAELMILIATAAVSGGASLAGAGPIMMATRFAIQRILRRAADQIIKRAVKKALRDKLKDAVGDRLKSNLARFGVRTVRESLEEGLEEAGVSAATQGYQIGEGNRQGWDRADLVQSFGVGTLAGSVANVTSLGGIRAGTGLGQFGERSLRGAAGEVLAEITVAVVTGQGVTLTSVGMAAASGTAGSAVGAGQHMLDSNLGLSHDLVFDALSDHVAPAAAHAHTPEIATAAPVESVASDSAASAASAPVETAGRAGFIDTTVDVATQTDGGIAALAGGAEDRPQPANLASGPTTSVNPVGRTEVSAPVVGPVDPLPSAPAAPSPASAGPGASGPGASGPGASGPVAPAPAVPAPQMPAQPAHTTPPAAAPPPPPAGSSPSTGEPFLVVTPAPLTIRRETFRPEITPGTPAVVIDNPYVRQEYADYVRFEIQQALRSRLLALVDQLSAGDSPLPLRRKQELIDHGIVALTAADIEPITEELWTITNRKMLNPNWGFTFGGENDTAITSQATGGDVPPAVESTRQYFRPGKYNPPLALHQQDVELAVPREASGIPVRFADLRGDWLRLINDGGPDADMCRAINCTDVVLSLLDTWLHGRPRVAAPRTFDRFTLDAMLRPLGGETDGAARIEAATGGRLQQFTSDREGFLGLEAVLRDAGHGACAVLIQERPNGDVHASTVHNQNGEILYVDAQNPGAALTGRPVGALRSDIIVLRPDSTQIDMGTSLGHWTVPDAPDPEGAPSAWSAPGIDPDLMLRDPTREQFAACGVGNATAADLGLADADLTRAEREQLAHVAMVSPRGLGFTQRSVSAATSDGVAAADLERRLVTGGWRGSPVHIILWGDGSLASLDHRRVRAAMRANLPRIPAVIHAPSDPITDWGERGETLADDLRRLPDGRWVAGGDEGEVVYPKGTVPQTCGEAAVFRAAAQRSLLPGSLFGTQRLPVTLAKPPGPAPAVALSPEAEERLHRSIRTAQAQADAVQGDLEGFGYPLRKLEHRIKTLESLARKQNSQGSVIGNPRAAVANDVLRFTLELPDGPGYTSSVAHLERAMADRGYESIQVKNFWARGNRFYGVNWTLRTPSGHPFEVQLSTQLSLRADSMTHEVYEILRRRDELEARRVHALLWMLSVNNELELPQAIPPGLATAHRPRDNGLPAWIARNPNEWDDYVVWLNENVRGLRGILAEFNLSIADFPVSSRRAKTMREGDLGLLRDL